ncbi:MAG: hypothetical protein CM15mP51_16700 [Porticoccaceae bacterium]|nr:MAG: hypothetical protein CM15mP51_16700 [Porticoccaceae bacterium]
MGDDESEFLTTWKFNLYNLLAVISAYMISLSNQNQDDLDSVSEIIPHLKAPLGRMEVISIMKMGAKSNY